MAQIFISHAEEDARSCIEIARGLEAIGYSTWYFEAHNLPGVSYIDQILEAIKQARAVVVILSPSALASQQIDIEIVHAHETGKVFVPLLRALTHEEFRVDRPNWAMIMGATVTLPLPVDNQGQIVPQLAAGLRQLGISPDGSSRSGSDVAYDAEKVLTFAQLRDDPGAMISRVLGGHTVLEYLGCGGSGWAYRARHGTLGKEACLKILYPLTAELEDLVRSAALGVRALAAVDHQNVIKVFDVGRFSLPDGKSLFLAMELIHGTPLDRWQPSISDGYSAFATRVRVACDLAEALQAAHNCRFFDETGFERTGLLHGDVKPANVLVRAGGQPVLIDFMIVDVQRALDRRYRLNIRNVDGDYSTAAFGTPGFMAPEQERDGIVTIRTDIYGLGMTLRSLFAAAPATTWKDVAAQQAQLRSLIDAMTKPDPAERPQTTDAVVSRLKELTDSVGADQQGSNASAIGLTLDDSWGAEVRDPLARKFHRVDAYYARPRVWHCVYCGWRCDIDHDNYLCRQCRGIRPFFAPGATMRQCEACNNWSIAFANYCEWCGGKFQPVSRP